MMDISPLSSTSTYTMNQINWFILLSYVHWFFWNNFRHSNSKKSHHIYTSSSSKSPPIYLWVSLFCFKTLISALDNDNNFPLLLNMIYTKLLLYNLSPVLYNFMQLLIIIHVSARSAENDSSRNTKSRIYSSARVSTSSNLISQS